MKTIGIVLACLVTTVLSSAAIKRSEAAEITTLEPDSVAKPFKNRFSHGKLIPAGAEWLVTAGQTGRNREGKIGKDIEEQADWAMKNLYNIVREAGMDSEDVVKMTTYYLDPAHTCRSSLPREIAISAKTSGRRAIVSRSQAPSR